MVPRQVADFLARQKVPYQVVTHDKAYTAQGVAAALHTSGRDVAKTVILKTANGSLMMVVLPAPRHVNLQAMQELLGTPVELAQERDFDQVFAGCEVGAEPPFGNLYDLPVYVDESLASDPEIAFNAGTHVDAIRMRYEDFERLVHPVVGRLTTSH